MSLEHKSFMNRCMETLFDEANQSEEGERTCLANEKAGHVMCSSTPSSGIVMVRGLNVTLGVTLLRAVASYWAFLEPLHS